MIPRATIIFTCSLCLNLLFIGMIGGHISNKWLQERTQSLNLDERTKPLIENSHKAMRERTKTLRKNIKENRAQLIEILTADTFDESAYQAKADVMNQTRIKIMESMAQHTKELAKTLNKEDRQSLAQRLIHKGRGEGKARPHFRRNSPRNRDSFNK